MKLLVRKTPSQDDPNQRNLLGNQASFEIPTGTITWLSIIYVVVSVLVNMLSSYVIARPQAQLDRDIFLLKERNFELQLLQRVLEADSLPDRKSSLQLLIKTGLLQTENKAELLTYLDTSQYLPKWIKRDLEALGNYTTANQGSSASRPGGSGVVNSGAGKAGGQSADTASKARTPDIP